MVFHRTLSISFPLVLASAVFAMPTLVSRTVPKGIDVSGFQPNVDWKTVKANGISFAYIKATEGTTFTSGEFSSQYTGAADAGLLRGAYHFAHPDSASGAEQAKYFLAHGGGWSKDGITLPGALDIENNPSGAQCYGISQSAMVAFIKDFVDTYYAKTTRFPVIYTTTNFWQTCTGDSKAFGTTSPLWIAHFASSPGPLPSGWSTYTFWQSSDNAAPNPGDADEFNGDAKQLMKIVTG